jgi:hypothetical protein
MCLYCCVLLDGVQFLVLKLYSSQYYQCSRIQILNPQQILMHQSNRGETRKHTEPKFESLCVIHRTHCDAIFLYILIIINIIISHAANVILCCLCLLETFIYNLSLTSSRNMQFTRTIQQHNNTNNKQEHCVSSVKPKQYSRNIIAISSYSKQNCTHTLM